MSLFWALFALLFAAIGIVTLVDIVRHRQMGWATVGWVVLVVILPFVGSIAYWLTRRATPQEVEGSYELEAERRRTRAADR